MHPTSPQEVHPFLRQDAIEEYCAANNLLVGGRDPPPTYFYTNQGMCQDNYVDAITEARKRRGSGRVNVCTFLERKGLTTTLSVVAAQCRCSP